MKYILYITLFIVSFNNYSFSQKNEVIEITGRILNAETNKPVRYAVIINTKKNKVTACDSLGYFYVTALKNDLLRIYALGFENEYISFKDSSEFNPDKILTIKLKRKIYSIGNVDVFAERWKDFVFEFSHTKLEKNKTQERIEQWFYSLVDPKELAQLAASAAIGIPINYKTKADKQKIKVEELKRKTIENEIIKSKYNPELVSEITGLNTTEAIKFMRYCNFNREFLLKATEYDIIVLINKKFETYLKNKIR